MPIPLNACGVQGVVAVVVVVVGVVERVGVDTITRLLAGTPSVSESLSMTLSSTSSLSFSSSTIQIRVAVNEISDEGDGLLIVPKPTDLRDVCDLLEDLDVVVVLVLVVIVLWLTNFRDSSAEEPRNWHVAAGLNTTSSGVAVCGCSFVPIGVDVNSVFVVDLPVCHDSSLGRCLRCCSCTCACACRGCCCCCGVSLPPTCNVVCWYKRRLRGCYPP